MKNILILIIACVLGYFAWQDFFQNKQLDALYEEPYVIVYGRDSCGWTHKYLKDLKEEGVEPIYEIVDNREIADELHSRMRTAGLDTSRYNLPVIDVNAQLFIRPELDIILTAWKVEE